MITVARKHILFGYNDLIFVADTSKFYLKPDLNWRDALARSKAEGQNYWILASDKICDSSTTSVCSSFSHCSRSCTKPKGNTKKTVMKFNEEGTVQDLRKGHSGWERTGRSVQNVNIVRQSLVQSPRKSIRRLSSETNIPKSSVQCILRQDIHAYPYKIHAETELTNEQKQKCVDFSNWFSGKLQNDADFLKKIHMTDECHFQLSGKVNSRNYQFWGNQNPGNAATEQIPRSVLKDTIWGWLLDGME